MLNNIHTTYLQKRENTDTELELQQVFCKMCSYPKFIFRKLNAVLKDVHYGESWFHLTQQRTFGSALILHFMASQVTN